MGWHVERFFSTPSPRCLPGWWWVVVGGGLDNLESGCRTFAVKSNAERREEQKHLRDVGRSSGEP